MTSLEFIEKEIKITNTNINHQISLSLDNINFKEKANFHKSEAQKLLERLKKLLQIKTELEAWEVVKWSISKEHLEDSQIRTMFGENPFMNITEEEKLIVKKALEVENENSRKN